MYVTLFPDPEMEPALVLQITAVFKDPETVAENVCDPLAEMFVLPGEIDTEMVAPPPELGEEGCPAPPQPESSQRNIAIPAANNMRRM